METPKSRKAVRSRYPGLQDQFALTPRAVGSNAPGFLSQSQPMRLSGRRRRRRRSTATEVGDDVAVVGHVVERVELIKRPP
jgi:hypothetical protein